MPLTALNQPYMAINSAMSGAQQSFAMPSSGDFIVTHLSLICGGASGGFYDVIQDAEGNFLFVVGAALASFGSVVLVNQPCNIPIGHPTALVVNPSAVLAHDLTVSGYWVVPRTDLQP